MCTECNGFRNEELISLILNSIVGIFVMKTFSKVSYFEWKIAFCIEIVIKCWIAYKNYLSWKLNLNLNFLFSETINIPKMLIWAII